MKIKMFVDLPNGTIIEDIKTICPVVNISIPVMIGYTRYVFEVDLPDRHFMDVGQIKLENAVAEEVITEKY